MCQVDAEGGFIKHHEGLLNRQKKPRVARKIPVVSVVNGTNLKVGIRMER